MNDLEFCRAAFRELGQDFLHAAARCIGFEFYTARDFKGVVLTAEEFCIRPQPLLALGGWLPSRSDPRRFVDRICPKSLGGDVGVIQPWDEETLLAWGICRAWCDHDPRLKLTPGRVWPDGRSLAAMIPRPRPMVIDVAALDRMLTDARKTLLSR
jgi:hypothetical protein